MRNPGYGPAFITRPVRNKKIFCRNLLLRIVINLKFLKIIYFYSLTNLYVTVNKRKLPLNFVGRNWLMK